MRITSLFRHKNEKKVESSNVATYSFANVPEGVFKYKQIEDVPAMERKAFYDWSDVFFGRVASDEYTKRFVKSMDIRRYSDKCHASNSYWDAKSEERISNLIRCYHACMCMIFTSKNRTDPDIAVELMRVVTVNLINRMFDETSIEYTYQMKLYADDINILVNELLKAIYLVAYDFKTDFVRLFERLNQGFEFKLEDEDIVCFLAIEEIFELPDFIKERFIYNNYDRIKTVKSVELILNRNFLNFDFISNIDEFMERLKKFNIKEADNLNTDFSNLLYNYFTNSSENIFNKRTYLSYDIKGIVSAVPKYFPEMIAEALDFEIKFMGNVVVKDDEKIDFANNLIDLFERIAIYKEYRSEELKGLYDRQWKDIIDKIFELSIPGYILTEVSEIMIKCLGVDKDEIEKYIYDITMFYLDKEYCNDVFGPKSFATLMELLSNPIVFEIVSAENPAIIDCWR